MAVEYKIVQLPDYASDAETYLNTIGSDSWELIDVHNRQAIFVSGAAGTTTIVSGTFTPPPGTVSSSAQYPGWVTSSTQIAWSSVNYNTGIVSSSTQITANLPAGTVSSSTQVKANLPGGIVSSSTQVVNYNLFALTASSNTFYTNQIISGTLFVSGGTEFGGDLVPIVAKGATIGTVDRPFRDIFLQSASINIASEIPGGPGAQISNTDGNVSIKAAGFQLKTGSFVPFEISETARIIVRVPNIPAGDIGAFSIIGNESGTYQPVTNAGGLLHLTSNDGLSSRITSDAFGTTANAAYVGRKARGTAAATRSDREGPPDSGAQKLHGPNFFILSVISR